MRNGECPSRSLAYCQSFSVVINYHKTSTYESEDTP